MSGIPNGGGRPCDRMREFQEKATSYCDLLRRCETPSTEAIAYLGASLDEWAVTRTVHSHEPEALAKWIHTMDGLGYTVLLQLPLGGRR
jgi:hypothetical protein